MRFFLFVALFLAVAFAFLAIQNPTVITLKFMKWNFSDSVAFILALIFATGILTGIFLFIPAWWRKAKLVRTQRRRIQELERELSRATEHKDASKLEGE